MMPMNFARTEDFVEDDEHFSVTAFDSELVRFVDALVDGYDERLFSVCFLEREKITEHLISVPRFFIEWVLKKSEKKNYYSWCMVE